jgi:hypothetical protein
MRELKPCPFCEQTLEAWGVNFRHSLDSDCILSSLRVTPADVSAWNTRAILADSAGQAEPIYEQRIESRFEVSWRRVAKDRFDALPEDQRRIVYATPPVTNAAQPAQDERGAFEDWWYAKINSGETPLDIAFGMHAEHIKARASSPAPSGAARDVLDAKKVREIAEGWHMHKATTVEDIEGAINDALTEIERIDRDVAKGAK